MSRTGIIFRVLNLSKGQDNPNPGFGTLDPGSRILDPGPGVCLHGDKRPYVPLHVFTQFLQAAIINSRPSSVNMSSHSSATESQPRPGANMFFNEANEFLNQNNADMKVLVPVPYPWADHRQPTLQVPCSECFLDYGNDDFWV